MLQNPHDKEHNDYAFVPIAKDNAVSYSQVKAQRLLPSEEIMNIARRSNGSALIKALRPGTLYAKCCMKVFP